MKTADIPREHRERAKEILLEYFGGEFPLYFINLYEDKAYINILGSALTRNSRGEITPEKFQRIRDQALGQIDVLREWKTYLFRTSPEYEQLVKECPNDFDELH